MLALEKSVNFKEGNIKKKNGAVNIFEKKNENKRPSKKRDTRH